MNIEKFEKSSYAKDLESASKALSQMRRDQDCPIDVSLEEYVKHRWASTLDSFFTELGIDPNLDTIQNFTNLPDNAQRWLLPEIFREALRLGLRKSPIYPNIISAEVSVKQPTMTMPWFNMSEATPKKLGVAETISTGTVSFDKKTVSIGKMGRGIIIPYEVQQYVSVNLVNIFLQDFGIKLGMGIDGLAIDALINGEQADGSESAPVVGVASAATLAYKDILKVWLRMARIGRTPDSIIGGESAALLTMDLAEFKTPVTGSPLKNLDIKTPLPQRSNYFIHGNIPANEQIILDSSNSIIKLNAQPLLVETDKKVSNQTYEYYASLTTGFCVLYRDARVILDHSLAIGSYPFPSYMDVDAQEAVTIE